MKNTEARRAFVRNLQRVMKMRGVEQVDIVEELGLTASTVSEWYHGKKFPRVDAMQRLADFLGVTMSELTSVEDDAMSRSTAIRVPVLGTIPAGVPLEAIEEVLDWEEIPISWGRGGKEFFALKISGDSMAPRYEPGDVIICRRQEKCESGQDAVVMVNSDDATFKRVRVSDAGIALQPLNPAYDPLFFTTRQVEELPVRIIGVAVEIRRTV
ncbi:MAG: helix-turn-helix domain-containing protein [Oscillospiraceae bacterium]|nr:helix-turn-helix domain-containing protein [Oscillospiraceae bacterium]